MTNTANSNRVFCQSCGWIGPECELLHAPHPFINQRDIYGCPNCREVENFSYLCDEPACNKVVTCGWPSADGYRSTCYEHYSWEKVA